MCLTNKDDFFDHENDNVESQEEKSLLESDGQNTTPKAQSVRIGIWFYLETI